MILVWTVENGRKTHQNENDNQNIAGGCVCRSLCGMRMEFYRFRTFYSKTHHNGSVDAN